MLLCVSGLGLRVGEFQCQTYPVGYFGLQGFFGGIELSLQGLGFFGVAFFLCGFFGVCGLQFRLEVVGAFGGFFCPCFGGGKLAAQCGVFLLSLFKACGSGL